MIRPLVFFLGVLALTACAASSGSTCEAICNGCCDARGVCQAGESSEYCGGDGQACASCGSNVCSAGTCSAPGGGDSSASGGGDSGTGGGDGSSGGGAASAGGGMSAAGGGHVGTGGGSSAAGGGHAATGGGHAGSGGGSSGTGGGSMYPDVAHLNVTLTGCSLDFSGDLLVSTNQVQHDSIGISSLKYGAITGYISLLFAQSSGTFAVSTASRDMNANVINFGGAAYDIWTNVSTLTPDPISGTVVIRAFDLDTGESDLTFTHVVLENPYDHSHCTVNGTVKTTGYSF